MKKLHIYEPRIYKVRMCPTCGSLSLSGQSTKACELFLKNRAAAVQTAIRQLRIEGATLLYIHKLCNIFFTSLLETAKEFEMDFAGNTGCYSAFVVWSKSAMRMFVDAFSSQVR